MQKPLWTSCFCFLWVLMVPVAILTHMALVKVIPSLEELPDNIEKGLDDVFKFKYLEADSKSVETAAASALDLCGVVASVSCPSKQYPARYTPNDKTSNTSSQRKIIQNAFDNSLSIVNKVANDKYFGIDRLKPTADSLASMRNEFDSTNDTMSCHMSTPIYCEIHQSSNAIVQGMSEVNASLDTFRNNEIVTKWEEYSDKLVLLHALPYIFVVGLMFYTIFWWKGAVCCCCKDGTWAGFLIVPFGICWLLSFIIYAIVCIIGSLVKYSPDIYKVDQLKGKPTLDVALEHFQTEFKDFWNLVFDRMSDGLNLLLIASFFVVASAIISLLYTSCVCCCRPYQKSGRDVKGEKSEEEKIQI